LQKLNKETTTVDVEMSKDNQKVTIKTRKTFWGDWRDWFFEEEEKPKVHHTIVKLYLDTLCVGTAQVPINFQEIHFEAEIPIETSMLCEQVSIEIPEMGIKRSQDLDISKSVQPGDTIRLTHDFILDTEN